MIKPKVDKYQTLPQVYKYGLEFVSRKQPRRVPALMDNDVNNPPVDRDAGRRGGDSLKTPEDNDGVGLFKASRINEEGIER